MEYFFENLLLNANHELKNRYLHIDYKNEVNSEIQSANVLVNATANAPENATANNDAGINDGINVGINFNDLELMILDEIKNNLFISAESMAKNSVKAVEL